MLLSPFGTRKLAAPVLGVVAVEVVEVEAVEVDVAEAEAAGVDVGLALVVVEGLVELLPQPVSRAPAAVQNTTRQIRIRIDSCSPAETQTQTVPPCSAREPNPHT
jgi:hypothetical protein